MNWFIKSFNQSAGRMVWYAFIFAVSFIAISFWSIWLVTHPTRIFVQIEPEQLSLPYDNVTLTTEDGLEIAGWFFKESGGKRPALVILHGYPAEKGDMLLFTREFFPHFDILA